MTPGDIVIVAFPGDLGTKVRQAVVLSTPVYLRHRPDVVLGLISAKPPDPLRPTDCVITAWKEAGLQRPSFFRLYLVTLLQRDVRVIGRLAEEDWDEVRRCVQVGMIEEA